MSPVRVLVVAAGTMAQAGMAALLESVDGLQVAAAVDPGAAVETARVLDPDLALVDLDGVSPGRTTLAAIVAELACPVVAVCEEGRADEALVAGARGAVGPGIPGVALGHALHAAATGVEVVYPPQRRPSPAELDPVALLETLTTREVEVLRLLPLGLTNQQVARRLGISEHTAKFHVSAVLGKLGVQSRAEAVSRAFQLGLISV